MIFGEYISHRGLHNINEGIPENSLKAFERSCEKNLAIELDVHMTKDGKLVVVHDNNLRRLCGEDVCVSDLYSYELNEYSILGTDEKIPYLSQVLRLVNGRVPIMIELKGDWNLFDLVIRVCHLLKKYKGDYAIASFNPIALLWFRIFEPRVNRIQLVTRFKGKHPVKYLIRRLCAFPFVWKYITKADFLACDLRSISEEDVLLTLANNVELIVWTAKNEELVKTALDFANTVIFENLPEDYKFDD
ncbi:MAG: glycerophosphodiester phosphodiesterase family protein [Oscillospiraceae bacterium]